MGAGCRQGCYGIEGAREPLGCSQHQGCSQGEAGGRTESWDSRGTWGGRAEVGAELLPFSNGAWKET